MLQRETAKSTARNQIQGPGEILKIRRKPKRMHRAVKLVRPLPHQHGKHPGAQLLEKIEQRVGIPTGIKASEQVGRKEGSASPPTRSQQQQKPGRFTTRRRLPSAYDEPSHNKQHRSG